MKNPKNVLRALPIIWVLCLMVMTQVVAAPLRQAETPQTAPTLNQNLYSQTATPGLNGEIRHTVLPDQFLFHIAELYGISLQELLSLNNLTEESSIFPGDQLIIVPGGETELGQGTQTPEFANPTATPTLTPTLGLVMPTMPDENIDLTATSESGFFQRVFSSNARWLAVGVIALVIFGVILLIISSKRIQ